MYPTVTMGMIALNVDGDLSNKDDIAGASS